MLAWYTANMHAESEFTIDDLGRMIAQGFSEPRTDMEKGFSGLRTELKSEIREIKQEVHTTNQRIDGYVVPELENHARRSKDLELKVA